MSEETFKRMEQKAIIVMNKKLDLKQFAMSQITDIQHKIKADWNEDSRNFIHNLRKDIDRNEITSEDHISILVNEFYDKEIGEFESK